MENGFLIIINKSWIIKIVKNVINIRFRKWGLIRRSWILRENTLILIGFKNDLVGKREKIKRLIILGIN